VYFVESLIATLYAAAVFAERLDRLGARLGLPEALLGLDVLPARATMALVGGLLVSCMVVVRLLVIPPRWRRSCSDSR
jgi:hypothetical protein